MTTLAPSPRRPTGRCLLSVVAPVYEEEAGLAEFHRRASAALTALPEDFGYELVLVDDGSTDTSWDQLRQLAAEDSHVVAHRLSRNFGHQLAITAGTELARGDVVVIIDSDLQDPPELIGEMLARWLEGWDVVYGRRPAVPASPASSSPVPGSSTASCSASPTSTFLSTPVISG